MQRTGSGGLGAGGAQHIHTYTYIHIYNMYLYIYFIIFIFIFLLTGGGRLDGGAQQLDLPLGAHPVKVDVCVQDVPG